MRASPIRNQDQGEIFAYLHTKSFLSSLSLPDPSPTCTEFHLRDGHHSYNLINNEGNWLLSIFSQVKKAAVSNHCIYHMYVFLWEKCPKPGLNQRADICNFDRCGQTASIGKQQASPALKNKSPYSTQLHSISSIFWI